MSARVLVVIRKEFREYRRNRFILVTMGALPIVLLALLVAETFALPEGASDETLRRPVGTALLFLQLIPVMLVGLAEVFAPQVVVSQIWTVDQAVAMAFLAPALAGFAIVVGILVSLRSSDFRVAQQLAVLASAPVIGFVALATFRVVEPSVGLYAAAAGVVCLMDVACWRLGLRLFSRERLLTARRTVR